MNFLRYESDVYNKENDSKKYFTPLCLRLFYPSLMTDKFNPMIISLNNFNPPNVLLFAKKRINKD